MVRTVRQTDVTKLIVVFRNFVDAHKKDFRGRGCAEVDTIRLVQDGVYGRAFAL